MRGVAALLVLGGHLLLLSYTGKSLGTAGDWAAHAGVVVFFVISGFLLYRPFVAARGEASTKRPVVSQFWLRRIVRILPAYWVALTVLAIWPGVNGFSEHWLADYTLLQVYDGTGVSSGLAQAWSLAVEASFYLALPFVALALQSRGWRSGGDGSRQLHWELGLLGGLAVISLAWRGFMASDPDTTYLQHNLLGTFSWFFLGMLLAVLQESHGERRALPWLSGILSRPSLCWPASALAFALLTSDAIGDAGLSASTTVVLEASVAGLFAVGLMGPAVLDERGRAVERLFANRVIAFTGLISYGIFLWHLSIAGWLDGTEFVSGSPLPFVTLGVVTLAASIALGTASWYAIERPLMRRVRSVKAFSHPGERSVEVPSRSESAPPVAAGPAEIA